jgi:Domain of unknown function (DUF4189)
MENSCVFNSKLLAALLFATFAFCFLVPAAHAEDGCGDGYMPASNPTTGVTECIPGTRYDQPQQQGPKRPIIWVDVYSAVAWHPNAADVWAVWNVRNEQGSGNGAEQYVMNACTRDMGEGCILAGSAVGGTIAVARNPRGTVFAAFGNTAGKAKSEVMALCAAKKEECAYLKSFTSKSWKEYADSNSNERYDRMKSYSPPAAKRGIAKNTVVPTPVPGKSTAIPGNIAAAAFSHGVKPWSEKVWISGGHAYVEDAKNAALDRCRNESGAWCYVFVTSTNGIIQVGMDNNGIVRANEAPTLQAAELDAVKKCGEAKVQCRMTVKFAAATPGTMTYDIVSGKPEK